eukprot:12937113-Prorocentrum_lima.AAC.1
MKASAAPGPSGWRNTYLHAMAEVVHGAVELRRWVQMWTNDEIPEHLMRLWTQLLARPFWTSDQHRG